MFVVCLFLETSILISTTTLSSSRTLHVKSPGREANLPIVSLHRIYIPSSFLGCIFLFGCNLYPLYSSAVLPPKIFCLVLFLLSEIFMACCRCHTGLELAIFLLQPPEQLELKSVLSCPASFLSTSFLFPLFQSCPFSYFLHYFKYIFSSLLKAF